MRVAIKTFGCRLNQAEAARFAADFAAGGWQVVTATRAADVVVVYGCAVTHTAEQKGLQVARRLKREAHAAGRPEPFVVLAGCIVEAGTPESPFGAGIDLIVPRAQRAGLAARVMDRLGAVAQQAAFAGRLPGHKRALLKVQDGCDFHCSYCIVPHLRGRPVSRPWQEVLDEARALARGAREIVVTGCNLACYRDGVRGLPELVAAVAMLEGVGRVRIGSVEPGTVERELASLMAANPRVCRQLHLPLQSGDAGILAAMRRRYAPEAYAATVREIARLLPDAGLGTDVIVGFPGESEAAFERTRALITELPFSNVHVFPYSERPGTPAAALGGAVPAAVRKQRARTLIALGDEKRQRFAASCVGQRVEVLIERVDGEGCGWGWTGAYLECRVDGLDRTAIGTLVPCCPKRVDAGVLVAATPVLDMPGAPARHWLRQRHGG